MTKRRRFTAGFKVRVTLDALRGGYGGTIRRPVARPGWPSGPGHSSWNGQSLQHRANTRRPVRAAGRRPRATSCANRAGRLGWVPQFQSSFMLC